MSASRQISWTAALREFRADRAVIAPGAARARAAAEGFAKIAANRARRSSSTFVVAGRYDRRAIMSAAVAAAQGRRAVTGEAWTDCLSAALKGTWAVAKAARLAAAH
ncbi:hypothetical protein [Methylobacterium oxalidis]|uniref:Uncharacterized protein n=1 Tax=Methylobacterium oxalidis TaxID=944322 RepID=A0A512JBX2_9HYPH|nr:hypothetical protein [Methylobacterium oxalidis]GEP07395.1 hypothetical protein MOX02_54330 [Methylobacterium oxalidis]GJE35341.1 hypothetical protein LDDCCGHA_5559 [Methylobacterium oxalidis]GLS67660.1 hypothetical protein GCM10007888_60450 [Methylobacterium oxalidis]